MIAGEYAAIRNPGRELIAAGVNIRSLMTKTSVNYLMMQNLLAEGKYDIVCINEHHRNTPLPADFFSPEYEAFYGDLD